MSRKDGEDRASRVLDLASYRKDRGGSQEDPVIRAGFTHEELLMLAVALDELTEGDGSVEELAGKIEQLLYE